MKDSLNIIIIVLVCALSIAVLVAWSCYVGYVNGRKEALKDVKRLSKEVVIEEPVTGPLGSVKVEHEGLFLEHYEMELLSR